MLSRRFATSAHAALRALPPLCLAVALLFPTLGPPALARAGPAADPIAPSIARLEVVIRKIAIHDDRDWGEGKFRFTVRVGEVGACPEFSLGGWGTCFEEMVRSGPIDIVADDDEARNLSVTVPRQGDTMSDRAIAPSSGILVQPNRT